MSVNLLHLGWCLFNSEFWDENAERLDVICAAWIYLPKNSSIFRGTRPQMYYYSAICPRVCVPIYRKWKQKSRSLRTRQAKMLRVNQAITEFPNWKNEERDTQSQKSSTAHFRDEVRTYYHFCRKRLQRGQGQGQRERSSEKEAEVMAKMKCSENVTAVSYLEIICCYSALRKFLWQNQKHIETFVTFHSRN